MACVVWLPPDAQLQGRFLVVLPQVRSTFSQGMPTISAATRCASLKFSVPRLPMPVWMYILPSGRITKSPSYPLEPATKVLLETPTPRTLLPTRLPLFAIRSLHLNLSAPLVSASWRKQLVGYPRLPFGPGGPNSALLTGAL